MPSLRLAKGDSLTLAKGGQYKTYEQLLTLSSFSFLIDMLLYPTRIVRDGYFDSLTDLQVVEYCQMVLSFSIDISSNNRWAFSWL